MRPGREDIIAHVLPDLSLGDVVHLRKPHPCGSSEWKVVRLGADIGIQCLGCGHRVLMPRRDLAKRIKRFVSRSSDEESPG
ncbi:MAG: DUF951 domain-containing protein [Anaerolineales bacterium]|jgi:hypothetical protein